MNAEYDFEIDEGEHSGRRRKGKSTSSGVPRWAWIGGGLLGLLLAANLVLALPSLVGGGDDAAPSAPSGFLTPALLGWLRLWVPALAALGVSVGGFFWAGVAISRYDRKSVRWVRTGFVVAAIAVIVLIMSVFEQSRYLDSVALTVVTVLLCPFAWSARVAAKSRHGGGRKRRNSEGDAEKGDVGERADSGADSEAGKRT